MKERNVYVTGPVTEQDKVRIAERYWHEMRREMSLAVEREQKAFQAYQQAISLAEGPTART